jgi:hypothetical protein
MTPILQHPFSRMFLLWIATIGWRFPINDTGTESFLDLCNPDLWRLILRGRMVSRILLRPFPDVSSQWPELWLPDIFSFPRDATVPEFCSSMGTTLYVITCVSGRKRFTVRDFD